MSKKKKTFWERIDELFDEISQEMSHMLREFYGEMEPYRPMWDAEKCCLEPLAEKTEMEDSYVITVDLPFVEDKESIDLNLEGEKLIIDAKTKKPLRFERWGTVQRKIEFNSYHKEIRLPEDVDIDGITASFKNGVLKIKIPKKKRVRIRIE
ncbi:MAG: Hsp20/alpha crystallin family protein [Candidatus Asgardarchaeia archaeon]